MNRDKVNGVAFVVWKRWVIFYITTPPEQKRRTGVHSWSVVWSVLAEPAGALTDRSTCASTTDLQEEHLSAMTIQHTDSAVPSGSLPTNQTTKHTCHHADTHAQHTHKTHTRRHHQNPTQPQKPNTKPHNKTQPPPQNQPPQKPKISAHGFGSAEKREGKRGKGKGKKRGKEKRREEERKEKYQHTGSNRGLLTQLKHSTAIILWTRLDTPPQSPPTCRVCSWSSSFCHV